MPVTPDIVKAIAQTYSGDDEQIRVLQRYFKGGITAEQIYDAVKEFLVPDTNEYYTRFIYYIKAVATLLSEKYPEKSKKAGELLKTMFTEKQIAMVDETAENIEKVDLWSTPPQLWPPRDPLRPVPHF